MCQAVYETLLNNFFLTIGVLPIACINHCLLYKNTTTEQKQPMITLVTNCFCLSPLLPFSLQPMKTHVTECPNICYRHVWQHVIYKYRHLHAYILYCGSSISNTATSNNSFFLLLNPRSDQESFFTFSGGHLLLLIITLPCQTNLSFVFRKPSIYSSPYLTERSGAPSYRRCNCKSRV